MRRSSRLAGSSRAAGRSRRLWAKLRATMWTDPEVLGGFLLVRRLAESAMASVHLAVRLADSSGKPLVLKRPPLGERASER